MVLLRHNRTFGSRLHHNLIRSSPLQPVENPAETGAHTISDFRKHFSVRHIHRLKPDSGILSSSAMPLINFRTYATPKQLITHYVLRITYYVLRIPFRESYYFPSIKENYHLWIVQFSLVKLTRTSNPNSMLQLTQNLGGIIK